MMALYFDFPIELTPIRTLHKNETHRHHLTKPLKKRVYYDTNIREGPGILLTALNV